MLGRIPTRFDAFFPDRKYPDRMTPNWISRSAHMLFELRGELPTKMKILIGVGGGIFFIVLWWGLVHVGAVPERILPSPVSVLVSIPELHFENALIRNALYSIKLNLWGYGEAIAIAVPLGFLIGLIPLFRGLLGPYIMVFRYLPITALIGVFIVWFGLSVFMKVHFLAVGILVYLLPVVVQRIDEVPQVYLDTIKTLGASKWQTVRKVYIPSVFSRLSDDVRVLVAISWTYIIIAEVVNLSEGGIGALIYSSARQSRPDKVFALLAIIILIGFLQDRTFKWLDRKLQKHKYAHGG